MTTSDLLYLILINLYKIGGPILMVIGTISGILNLMVFTKNTLRKNPCTICFIAININNLIYFYLGLLFTVLATGYNIDPSSYNIGFCRFRFYIALVLASWQASFLVLASIDRILVTSPNATTRRRSSRRLIAISMIGIVLFWILFHIHALIFMEILQYGPDYFVCFYQPGAYSTFMTYCSLVINGSLPPILLAVFGCWAVKNIRQVRRGRQVSGSTNTGVTMIGRSHTLQSKDHQLIRILFMEIITYVICKCPVTIFYIYQEITKDNYKSVEQNLIEQYILQLTYFLYFIENCTGCYTNILVSKTFRIELKNVFINFR